jgi:magnesium chelatase family protein
MNYRSRISGPLLDRIDIIVEVPAVNFEQLRRRKEAEPSAAIEERVDAARGIQVERYGTKSGKCNSRMGPDDLREYCKLDAESAEMLRRAFDVFGLTARSYDKILKVARTIADMEGSRDITSDHIAEAIQYRTVNI